MQEINGGDCKQVTAFVYIILSVIIIKSGVLFVKCSIGVDLLLEYIIKMSVWSLFHAH